MRKISGHVVSTKPISLSRAAKLISRFAAVDNGSSAAVALYLQRSADAFNHLVQFHDKRGSKLRNVDTDQKSLQIDGVKEGSDGDEGKYLEIGEGKVGKRKTVEIPVKERRKKKKKQSSRDEGVDS